MRTGAPERADDPGRGGEAFRAYDDGSWLAMAHYCVACGRWVSKDRQAGHNTVELPPRLWIYTNYDCNLACAYCLVSSSPYAERRAISLDRYQMLVREAHALGVQELFLTGGEPFLLPDVFEMIAIATAAMNTTVLSNAMLLHGNRLDRLATVNGPRLSVQVSLDDDHPGAHDACRGEGSWEQTLSGIRALMSIGVRVRIATTVTPTIEGRLEHIRRFVRETLRIPEEDHIVRPVLRRGFADEGLDVHKDTLVPEVTVDARGVYWHPAGTDADLLVTTDNTSLRFALEEIARLSSAQGGAGKLQPFR